MLRLGLEAVERGIVPDAWTRWGIRNLCHHRIQRWRGDATSDMPTESFMEALASSPLAFTPDAANQQHYELPPEFFQAVLGRRRKYSCCYWENKQQTLDEAEEAALRITCERAQIENGQRILELGSGWGSLSLWMAEHYPASQITAVSNSDSQRRFVEQTAAERGYRNLRVLKADMNSFAPSVDNGPKQFDRVVSIEMFEHMRNYELLLGRIASWLRPEGKLFVHIFCHRERAYPFESDGPQNWMGRYFFTGGLMPSANLLRHFDHDLQVVHQWRWDGKHYRRTADAWLQNLDNHVQDVVPILESVYGRTNARRWLNRWRMFFLAVAEVFAFADGKEWFVSHYLFEPAR